ncbi:MAG: lysylphosphatidylglycerol synthase domain-containing protein [Pusillimonas sp.]
MMAGRGQEAVAWIKAHWATIRKIAAMLFIALVVVLLSVAVTHVEWDDVLTAIRQLAPATLGLAALIALCSYLLYSCFDLLGRHYTGHGLAWWRCMMVGFISYAFTMNMGAPVGGMGLRMRLYSKQGLQAGVIARVVGFCIATNWMGYVLLAGSVFALGFIELPEQWEMGSGALRVVGCAMMLAVIGYVLLCAFSPTRSWKLRGHIIELPSLRIALVQLLIAALNWSLMAAVIYVLLRQQVAYPIVLGTLLISAIAGVITHIPGGLGVIEAVFIALLASPSLPRYELLGAILVYRAVYYLAPLLVAGAWYLAAEAKMNGPKTT